MPRKPRIAILGAGPVGLDAALAAVDAGYPFTLFEAAPEVAGNIRSWEHVRLFSPWDLDLSPRMARQLEALGLTVPVGDDCPTGGELVDRVLAPVAQAPTVSRRLRLSTRVLAVTRQGLLKNEEIGTAERGAPPFRLLLADPSGHEWTETADVVLDCTGVWDRPNPVGDGGIPAPGERQVDDRIHRTIPDVDREGAEWAGTTTLLVGAGHSAQTAARDLARLAETAPDTRVVWALRSPAPRFDPLPDDALPERSRLLEAAQALVDGASDAVEIVPGVVVESLAREGERVRADLRRADGGHHQVRVDRILALTGAVGDDRLYRQLQVHECYATSGPMKLAAALLAGSSDCLAQESPGVETLRNPEPDFFILGAKSYGRTTTFLMRIGWDQVDEVFAWLAERWESSPVPAAGA